MYMQHGAHPRAPLERTVTTTQEMVQAARSDIANLRSKFAGVVQPFRRGMNRSIVIRDLDHGKIGAHWVVFEIYGISNTDAVAPIRDAILEAFGGTTSVSIPTPGTLNVRIQRTALTALGGKSSIQQVASRAAEVVSQVAGAVATKVSALQSPATATATVIASSCTEPQPYESKLGVSVNGIAASTQTSTGPERRREQTPATRHSPRLHNGQHHIPSPRGRDATPQAGEEQQQRVRSAREAAMHRASRKPSEQRGANGVEMMMMNIRNREVSVKPTAPSTTAAASAAAITRTTQADKSPRCASFKRHPYVLLCSILLSVWLLVDAIYGYAYTNSAVPRSPAMAVGFVTNVLSLYEAWSVIMTVGGQALGGV